MNIILIIKITYKPGGPPVYSSRTKKTNIVLGVQHNAMTEGGGGEFLPMINPSRQLVVSGASPAAPNLKSSAFCVPRSWSDSPQSDASTFKPWPHWTNWHAGFAGQTCCAAGLTSNAVPTRAPCSTSSCASRVYRPKNRTLCTAETTRRRRCATRPGLAADRGSSTKSLNCCSTGITESRGRRSAGSSGRSRPNAGSISINIYSTFARFRYLGFQVGINQLPDPLVLLWRFELELRRYILWFELHLVTWQVIVNFDNRASDSLIRTRGLSVRRHCWQGSHTHIHPMRLPLYIFYHSLKSIL